MRNLPRFVGVIALSAPAFALRTAEFTKYHTAIIGAETPAATAPWSAPPDALELWDNIGRNYKRVCHKKVKGC